MIMLWLMHRINGTGYLEVPPLQDEIKNSQNVDYTNHIYIYDAISMMNFSEK